ncbi:hypothetical protein [Marinococcus halotolerans]|uniref:hypothetical protein n=1 Tax=Marinococcus halotolerans TaxID=301092 RepID=UPI0003B5D16B|nr:hypothetical protein [Marinococcus halotolerans]
MQHFTFIKLPQEREVVAGTRTDLKQHGWTAPDAVFTSVDELFASLQGFREQEWIITCVSDLPVLKQRWESKWETEPPALDASLSVKRFRSS